MKIKIYNDCKEKFDSFEASIEYTDDINLMSFGGTEEDAIEELKMKIKKRIKELEELLTNNPMNKTKESWKEEIKEIILDQDDIDIGIGYPEEVMPYAIKKIPKIIKLFKEVESKYLKVLREIKNLEEEAGYGERISKNRILNIIKDNNINI